MLIHGYLTTSAAYANVQINGKRAVIENKTFFLNDLDVPAGNFEINVNASDSNRNQAVKIISVSGDANGTGVELTIGGRQGT